MKKIYLDRTEDNGCTSVFVRDAEIIPAGTTVYSMPVSDKNSEYQRYADEYDIHFIFDDDVLCIDFYTVPHIDIMAVDSDGGCIGTVGQCCDLESDAPICYIDREKKCYLVAENGADFIEHVSDWKTRMKPYRDVVLYQSLEDAQRVLEFIDSKVIVKL